jgi:diguanylate cyclase (GGDEF)-like protein
LTVPTPANEAQRIAALRAYEVLDTACEASFDNIARLASMVTGCPIAAVSFTDVERQWFKARIGTDLAECPRELAFCAHAILQPDRPMVVDDATQDVRFRENPLVNGPASLRFYAGAPLVNPAGQPLGTLCVMDRRPRRMSTEHRQALAHLAETVVTTLELRRAMNQARGAALSDPLTDLGNRRALLDALTLTVARHAASGVPFTLLYLDLDGFKRVNDQQGHATGDRVLRQVAEVMRGGLPAGGCAARLGGDEFAMLFTDDRPEAVAERLRQALETAMSWQGWAVTASIGAVTVNDAGFGVDEVLAAADASMYRAKGAGKNRVQHQWLSQVSETAA